MNESYKIYLTDGTTSKTITENRPNLSAQSTDFAAAANQLERAYNLPVDRIALSSETTVWVDE